MPAFFAIDLGTTNCAIKHFSINDVGSMLAPRGETMNRIVSVPFYYEHYQYNESMGCFTDSSTDTNAQIRQLTPTSGFAALRRAPLMGTSPAPAGSNALLLMPSVVLPYRLPSGEEVWLTGAPAMEMYEKDRCTGTLYENTKSLLDQQVDYDGVKAVDIAEHLLRTCFASILHYMQQKRNMTYSKIVISYPASRNQQTYLSHLREAAFEAAQSTGLISKGSHEDFFMATQEPYAAILNLAFKDVARMNSSRTLGTMNSELSLDKPGDRVVMVVDLGGGTSDICLTILRPSGDGTSSKTLCTYPENTHRSDRVITCAVNLAGNFGGADFDRMLASRILQCIRGEAEPRAISDENPILFSLALRQAQQMKHFFSNAPDKALYEELTPYILGGDDATLTLSVTRSEYVRWLAPYIESQSMGMATNEEKLYKRIPDDPGMSISVRSMVESTLGQANATWHDVDALFLTGGTSRMPEVQQLMKKMLEGSECRLIVSKDCFFDIAAGAALYGALNSSDASGVSSYSRYTPAPRSSIALMCDGRDGMEPQVLIGHSEAIDGSEKKIAGAFEVKNTLFKWIQLYTGTSYWHPNYAKLQLMKIDINGQASAGTPIDLYYKIDQNMKATLSAGFVNVRGEYVKQPVESINLDGTEVLSGVDEEAVELVQNIDIARGVSGKVYLRGNRILTTVITPAEVKELIGKAARYLEMLQDGQPGIRGYNEAQSALSQMVLDHLDVLCYAIMLHARDICRTEDAVQRLCSDTVPGLICSTVEACGDTYDGGNLNAFSQTLYKMLAYWPGNERWHMVNKVLSGIISRVKLAEAYKARVIRAYCSGLLREPLNWQGSERKAFDALMYRARNMPDDAVTIFEHVLDFFGEYAGAGKHGISLPQNLGGTNSAMRTVFQELPEECKLKIRIMRTKKLDYLDFERKQAMKRLTGCMEADNEDVQGDWLTVLQQTLGNAADENVRKAVEAINGLKVLPRDINYQANPLLVQTLGKVMQSGMLTEERARQGVFQIILAHALAKKEQTWEAALEALENIRETSSDGVAQFYNKIGRAVLAIFGKGDSKPDFDGLISAYTEQKDLGRNVGPVWKQLLKNKYANQPFRAFMKAKLNAGANGVSEVQKVLNTYYRAYCFDAYEEERVQQYAVPHAELAQYIMRVSGLNVKGESSLPQADVHSIVDYALRVLKVLVTSSNYSCYKVLFNSLLVYYSQPGIAYKSFQQRIAEIMTQHANRAE